MACRVLLASRPLLAPRSGKAPCQREEREAGRNKAARALANEDRVCEQRLAEMAWVEAAFVFMSQLSRK